MGETASKALLKSRSETSKASPVPEEGPKSQAGPALPKPMLTGPDHLLVLCVPREGTPDDLLHNLPLHRGQTDTPLAPHILLPAFLVDVHRTG